MNTQAKGIYSDPAGPLERALLLPETKVFLLQLLCRKHKPGVKQFALSRLGFKEKAGSPEIVAKACACCGGEESLELDVGSGLAVCQICKKETDLVRLTRGNRCPYLVYALDYLLNQLLEGDHEEKKRLVARLESLTKAIHDSLIVTGLTSSPVVARFRDRLEQQEAAGGEL
jgi:hypothetical protein